MEGMAKMASWMSIARMRDSASEIVPLTGTPRIRLLTFPASSSKKHWTV